MKFKNTIPPTEIKDFKEIVFSSLAQNKSLYVPEKFPLLPQHFLSNLKSYSLPQIGAEVLSEFTKEFILKEELLEILEDALNFDIPLVRINQKILALELFHGPTKAFKDIGARTMSRIFSKLNRKDKITILAATSGDTGSAVANGFHNVSGVEVVILFPKGMVSAYQEFQMTSLGNNIRVLEVNGTFDDCQRIVKQAFRDTLLNERLNLSSANSINLARLLPQMIYYFWAVRNFENTRNEKLVFCVPSGNLGNVTAGLYAKKMGLPIHRLIAAENHNDSFYRYLNTGVYEPKGTIPTYSNAMDVGAPSNFERILHLFENNLDAVRKEVSSSSIPDQTVLETIKKVHQQHGYILDPHGAVGFATLEKQLKEEEIGILLETAHPIKFEKAVQKALPDFKSPTVDLSNCRKTQISSDFESIKNYLLKS